MPLLDLPVFEPGDTLGSLASHPLATSQVSSAAAVDQCYLQPAASSVKYDNAVSLLRRQRIQRVTELVADDNLAAHDLALAELLAEWEHAEKAVGKRGRRTGPRFRRGPAGAD